MKAWVGLGSNLQQPVEQLNKALRRLASSGGVKISRVSSFYRTPPWGDEDQDDFVNAVVEVETSLEPLPLLHALQAIENEMGRQRGVRHWGPRLIDLDLLLMGDHVLQTEELTLPHPHISERAFVLLPICELDSSLDIPGFGEAALLLNALDCSGIQRLDGQGQK